MLDWCDALVRLQVHAPANHAADGAICCPARGFVHGRCADAVYPLLAAARLKRSAAYTRAAIRLMKWSNNVDAPDGAWTNEVDIRLALRDASGTPGGGHARLSYRINSDFVQIEVSATDGGRFILPVIALPREQVRRAAPDRIVIQKLNCTVEVTAATLIEICSDGRSRVFNLVPGFFAIPLEIPLLSSTLPQRLSMGLIGN